MIFDPSSSGDTDALQAMVERSPANSGVRMAQASETVCVLAEEVGVDRADTNASVRLRRRQGRSSRRLCPRGCGARRSGSSRSAGAPEPRPRAVPTRYGRRQARDRRGSACRSFRSPTRASRSRALPTSRARHRRSSGESDAFATKLRMTFVLFCFVSDFGAIDFLKHSA